LPTYEFLDTKTDEIFETIMKISEREEFLLSNPHIQPVISAPMLVSSVSTTGKVPDGFKEVLSKIAEKYPNSSVADRHGRRSAKEAKTRDIVKKYTDKMTKNIK
jgi:hypothetical protein